MTTRYFLFISILLMLTVAFMGSSIYAQNRTPNASNEGSLVAESGEGEASGTADHGGAEEGEGHGKSSGWGTYWKPAVTQILGLLLLIFVYIQWVHPLLKRQHEERNDRIQSDLAYIEEEKEKIDNQEKEIEEKMENIEKRAGKEREEILERGRQLKEETIEEAKQHAEETIQSAREEADRIRERAILEIRNSMTESALAALRSYFQEEAGQELHEHFRENLIDAMKDVESLDQFQHGNGDDLQGST